MAPIHDAACRGDVEKLKRILAEGTDINFTSENEKTALHFAAANNKVKALKLLLSIPNCVIDHQCTKGETPLLAAAKAGHEAAVSALLAAGARPDVKDFRGQSAENLAAKAGHQAIVAMLRAATSAPVPVSPVVSPALLLPPRLYLLLPP